MRRPSAGSTSIGAACGSPAAACGRFWTSTTATTATIIIRWACGCSRRRIRAAEPRLRDDRRGDAAAAHVTCRRAAEDADRREGTARFTARRRRRRTRIAGIRPVQRHAGQFPLPQDVAGARLRRAAGPTSERTPAFDADLLAGAAAAPTRAAGAAAARGAAITIVPCDPTQASRSPWRARGRQLHHSGAAGHRQIADDHQPDRRLSSPRASACCSCARSGRPSTSSIIACARRGLDELCCLIHDSQDRQEGVHRSTSSTTYEAFLDEHSDTAGPAESERRRLLDVDCGPSWRRWSVPAAMRSTPPQAGLPLRSACSSVPSSLRESLPPMSAPESRAIARPIDLWHDIANSARPIARTAAKRFSQTACWPTIRCGCCTERFGQMERPLARDPTTMLAGRRGSVEQISKSCSRCDVPAECWDSLDELGDSSDYARAGRACLARA